MAEVAPTTKKVKMYHFTCTTCRKKNVNTLFCTLMDPAVVSSCICPHFVHLHGDCAGPGGEGLFHISLPLDNVDVANEEEMSQFIVSIGEGLGTEGHPTYVHNVSCAHCETLIGYEYVRMVSGGGGQTKLTIVGNRLLKDNDINSNHPVPTYLLSERQVTKFLTKRK